VTKTAQRVPHQRNEVERERADAICIARQCDLRSGPSAIHHCCVAIQFARARYISRSSGGSAVRSAAYNERAAITADRTGELFYFRHRDAPEHHEVLLPAGADSRFANSAVLWNAAEAAEKRKDAQVAREIVLALPANAELTDEDRVGLARSFAQQHFVTKGLAVQLDVHRPHEGEGESERANWHAHLRITRRRIEGDRLAAKKARDLDPAVRLAGGRAVVADGEAWGELWRDHQNRYFVEHGLTIRVDPAATHAREHIGPVRMRKAGAAIIERAETIRQANEAAARDPDQVLATLTRHNATFSERDLDRHLVKHITPEAESAAVKTAVLKHTETLALYDRTNRKAAERYTTKTGAQEIAALADAKAVAGPRGAPTLGPSLIRPTGRRWMALDGQTLNRSATATVARRRAAPAAACSCRGSRSPGRRWHHPFLSLGQLPDDLGRLIQLPLALWLLDLTPGGRRFSRPAHRWQNPRPDRGLPPGARATAGSTGPWDRSRGRDIEHHGVTAPGEHGGDADGGGLEAGAAGIDEQGRGAALSPAAAVCRIERPSCHAGLIDAVGLADRDGAIARIRTREEAVRLADRAPVGVAVIVGSAADQTRAATGAECAANGDGASESFESSWSDRASRMARQPPPSRTPPCS